MIIKRELQAKIERAQQLRDLVHELAAAKRRAHHVYWEAYFNEATRLAYDVESTRAERIAHREQEHRLSEEHSAACLGSTTHAPSTSTSAMRFELNS
jgi:hypothetical protein